MWLGEITGCFSRWPRLIFGRFSQGDEANASRLLRVRRTRQVRCPRTDLSLRNTHPNGAGVIESVGSGVEPKRMGERVWTWNADRERPFGTCASSSATVHMLLVYLLTESQRQRACALIIEVLEVDELKNAIGARVALRDTAQAHIAVESGSAIGNVVVTVE